jgi:transglutaminase-like putative cysteine protease
MKKRPPRWWDLPAAFFLLSCLMVVAFRLGDTRWTENLDIVSTTTFLGCVLGLALGYSTFKRWAAFLIAAGYTLTIPAWQLTAQMKGEVAWLERLSSLGGRLWTGLQTFFQNQPLTDPLPFLANMVALFWLVSLIAGYNLTRHGRPWQGVLVAGVAMVVIDIYHLELGKGGFGMAVFIIFALLLLTRMYFLTNARRWEEAHVSVDHDTGWSFGRGALVTAFLLVLLAWNVTTVAKAFTPATRERREVVNMWRILRQRFENITAPLRGSVPVPVEYYDEEFSLGTGAILSDDPVMTVSPDIARRIGVNYYWKMRTYDRYLDGRWYSTLEQIKGMEPGDPSINIGPLRGRMAVRFRFRTLRNMGMLVAPSLTLAVSRPVTLIYGPADGDAIDLVAVEIDPMLRAGETYEVYARVSAPTVSQLKTAGSDYPGWVRDSYLQVPVTTPESIKNLALEITRGLETPYEKTVAITAWLRENIRYSAVIPAPPDDVDAIEWVLFTEKKAFCNYYATAEVLMLRSLGIPARWAVGYAQGAFNEEKKLYEVLAKDSHAWPEVYFPGYGWIEFEPTASLPEINRPSGDNASSESPLYDPTGGTFLNDPRDRSLAEDPRLGVDLAGAESAARTFIQPLTALTLVVSLSIVAAILFLIRQAQRDPRKALPVLIEKAIHRRGWRTPALLQLWVSYTRLTPIERAFLAVEWTTRLMGAETRDGLTPTEQLKEMVKVLPAGEAHGSRLLDEYQKAIYSPHPADLLAARQASRALIRMALITRIKKFGEAVLFGGTKSKAASEWDI